MSRNKLVTILLVFVAAFGCVVALMRKPAAQTWRLPDGSELSLAKVTYGKTHEMRSGNGWRDYLFPVLPASLRAKLGCNGVTLITGDPTVVVWFWLKNQPPPGILLSGLPSTTRSYHLVVVDENGEIGVGSGQFNSTPELELDNWSFSTRSKEIKIRIYAPTDENETRGQLVAEIKIPNPNAK
jgi:hypothetical protein